MAVHALRSEGQRPLASYDLSHARHLDNTFNMTSSCHDCSADSDR
jgi:hypothetical protein